jgi:hypothetical protein
MMHGAGAHGAGLQPAHKAGQRPGSSGLYRVRYLGMLLGLEVAALRQAYRQAGSSKQDQAAGSPRGRFKRTRRMEDERAASVECERRRLAQAGSGEYRALVPRDSPAAESRGPWCVACAGCGAAGAGRWWLGAHHPGASVHGLSRPAACCCAGGRWWVLRRDVMRGRRCASRNHRAKWEE